MSIIHRICITFANCIARCFNPPPWLSEGLELPEDIYLLDTCLKDPSVHFFIHGQLQLKEHLVNFAAQEQVNLYKKGGTNSATTYYTTKHHEAAYCARS